jgi:hypothetical protein
MDKRHWGFLFYFKKRSLETKVDKKRLKVVSSSNSYRSVSTHPIKLVVKELEFQFLYFQYVRLGELPETWPAWVENSTILSHLLLAINASVNLLLYCSCDKHFWVITQKTLKKWFVWPFTMRMEMTRIDSVTEVAKPGPQTMTTEL